MIKSKTFTHGHDVVVFCNEENITKEKIVALIYKEDRTFCYELFYECDA